jgi:hypothetical protein
LRPVGSRRHSRPDWGASVAGECRVGFLERDEESPRASVDRLQNCSTGVDTGQSAGALADARPSQVLSASEYSNGTRLVPPVAE